MTIALDKLSKASLQAIAINALSGHEPTEEILQALLDIDMGKKTTEQVIAEIIALASMKEGQPNS